MLKRLQRRFVTVAMVFLAFVFLGTLGSNYVATNQNLTRLVANSLNRVLNTATPTRPYIGVLEAPDEDETIYGQQAVVWIDIDTVTGETDVDESAAIIGPRALSAVLNAATTSQNDMGSIPQFNVVWKRGPIPGGIRIAVANAAAATATMTSQLIMSLAIGILVLIVIFLFVWRLSTWMLKPVRVAWETQRQFTSDASHELKTPLSVIVANTRILKKSSNEIPQHLVRWVDSTDDEAKRMQILVNALLELSRADEVALGQESIYAKVDVDLSKLVEESCLEFEVMAFEQGLELASNVAPAVHVLGDPRVLDQALRILLDNALKYAAPHSVVSVSLALTKNATCSFWVNNQGEPLSMTDQEHIFDRFYRSDSSRSRETGGFGLGLAIAQAIVHANGGEISCESSEAKGTTFTIRLPLLKGKSHG